MTKTDKSMKVRRYNLLAESITTIFEYCGFNAVHQNTDKEIQITFDVEKDGEQYVFAFKESRDAYPDDDGVLAAANEFLKMIFYSKTKRIPILVIVGVVSSNIRNQLLINFPNLVVIDVQNLLNMVHGNEELRTEFISRLQFSIEGLKPLEPSFETSMADEVVHLSADKPVDEDEQLLEKWVSPDDNGKAYEEVCRRVLKKLFGDDLYFYPAQTTTEEGMFRFDLICKIKWKEKREEFWNMAEQYFRSKYIVFEFKDYGGKVTQKEIFTTVKYLYPKALRGVAIMCCANGINDHAGKAIRGILREEGKLIITLSNHEMAEMLRMKGRKENPAEYLSQKLDSLLISLEK